MPTLREWLLRLIGTLRPRRRDSDIEDELRAHVELAAEAAERRGEAPDDAWRRALIQSGGTTQAAQTIRAQRGLPWAVDLGRDVRYACRVLLRSPGFTTSGTMRRAWSIRRWRKNGSDLGICSSP